MPLRRHLLLRPLVLVHALSWRSAAAAAGAAGSSRQASVAPAAGGDPVAELAQQSANFIMPILSNPGAIIAAAVKAVPKLAKATGLVPSPPPSPLSTFDKVKGAVETAVSVESAVVQADIASEKFWMKFFMDVMAAEHNKEIAEQPEKIEDWPSGRGGRDYGWSWFNYAPFDLKLRWKWQHPEGRFHTLGYGTAIDRNGSIYLTAADGLRKFNAAGKLLWEHTTLPAEVTNAAVVTDGKVIATDTHGRIFALNASSGKVAWRSKVCDHIAQDNGFVTESYGVVVTATDASPAGERNTIVRGVNATTGETLWTFEPDVNVWNFMASFTASGTTLFQDQTGKAYHLMLSNGTLIWKDGGFPGSWTDGTGLLGPNDRFYSVQNNADHGLTNQFYGADHEGAVIARDVGTGRVLWNVTTPRPPNNAPAVGRVYGYPGYTVVQPMGQQGQQGAPTDVYAYDGLTGDVRWVFKGPAQKGTSQAGDDEGKLERMVAGVRYACLPNPWSAPVIDASGTVFIGNQDGLFYALRDLNTDGVIEGPDEVSSFDTEAAFSGSAGPSLASGRVVVASCDSLYVFGNA